jgi:DinB superfamily
VEERIIVADPVLDSVGYQRELLVLLGDTNPLDVLAATPQALRGLTAGLSDELLSQRPEPAEWSATEVLGHLWDGELMVATRGRLILAQDEPPLLGYDQDAWARLPRQPFAEMLESYTVLRAANLNLIRSTPTPEHDRVGVHSERGRMSFRLLYQEIAGHDRAHLRQLEQTIAAVTA